MKLIFLAAPLLFFTIGVSAQSSTFEKVYNIIEENCASCHSPGNESGLVLSGSSSEIFDALYNISPVNDAASDKGYKTVYPGDPYKSFLFSKINNDLALDVSLAADEGTPCPKDALTIK